MRVVTLLPAATEIVAALGAAGTLVGVSHECDHPDAVASLPRVTAPGIDASLSSAAIDAAVRRARADGRASVIVDADRIRLLRPDVIITQALCDVCAVSDGSVVDLAAALEPAPLVVVLGGRTIDGVLRDIDTVGRHLGREGEAADLAAALTRRLAALAPGGPRASQALGIPRVACVEWLDPLYLAGHWVPELVAAAGGEDVGGEPGGHSFPRTWAEVERLRPDVVIVMLCGFGIGRARAELDALTDPAARAVLSARPVWILDGNACTSRPGPRIVDGAERIHAALHGRAAEGLARYHFPI